MIVLLGFILAVLFPVVTDHSDSFPLSTYPMFAKPRGTPELNRLVAITTNGTQVAVAPGFLGTGEVLQAKVQLNQVAQKGRKARARFCSTVAEKVSTVDTASDWVRLELQRVTYDPIEYFANGGTPLSQEVLTHCSVPRAAASQPLTNEQPND